MQVHRHLLTIYGMYMCRAVQVMHLHLQVYLSLLPQVRMYV